MKQVMPGKEKIWHQTFRIGIFLKGLDGVLEMIGGTLLWLASPALVNAVVFVLTQHELSTDPHDLIANFLVRAAQNLSASSQIFAAVYLLLHGTVKASLVVALWKEKIRAYPAAILLFIIFGVYQFYRYFYDHSLFLLFLTLLDIAVVGLTWKEYLQLKRKID